jgi:pimeloyl-ACP methyl ester carboxylesterase
MLIHKNRLGDTKLSGKIMTIAKNIGKKAFIREKLMTMSRKNSFDFLSRASCPTVVICGCQDNLTPLAQHQAKADAIPNAILLAIQDSVHLSPIEQPHAVSAALRYWLQV